jgi:hypothetical protein
VEVNRVTEVDRVRAEAVLLDDGHVQFTHQCLDGPDTTILPNSKWHVVQKDPLTVQPSVHCRRCEWHGWIENGAASNVTPSWLRPSQ